MRRVSDPEPISLKDGSRRRTGLRFLLRSNDLKGIGIWQYMTESVAAPSNQTEESPFLSAIIQPRAYNRCWNLIFVMQIVFGCLVDGTAHGAYRSRNFISTPPAGFVVIVSLSTAPRHIVHNQS